jgi:Dolichyl-phosphate-mannose-protein mannosyltransferase
MTSIIDRTPAAPGRLPLLRGRRLPVVWIAALAAVALRLPLLSRPPSPDEAGFLLVGGQWHSGGSSLYGDYWVDRPPLLITLFRAAADAGGLVPLRVLGCVATVLAVLGVAHLARQLGGRRAAGWAALLAAVLLVSPLTGAQSVNGELLAEPIVIWGMVAAVHALRGGRRSTLLAAAAGAAVVCSMLVKQNFADVAVFAAAAGAIALWRRELTASRAGSLLGGFAIGALGALAVVGLWTIANGTSLVGVYDAMFPFRVQAGQLLTSPANHGSRARLSALLLSWVMCGGALAMAATAWALWRRRLGGTLVWALVITIGFEVVSVFAGGNYWNHYLIQLVGPLSVLVGIAAGRALISARVVLVASAVIGVIAWTVALPWQTTSLDESVGSSIRAVSSPDDTIVTVYGHSNVDLAAGLSSPYPYLWALPTKARDPQLHTLAEVLSGPQAPTWFLTWAHLASWGVDSSDASRVLAARYHPVAHLGGHTVYLRDGVRRTAPTFRGPVPRTPPLITTALEELLQ